MLLNHDTAFTTFQPVDTQPRNATRRPRRAAFAAGTMIDTAKGWTPVEALAAGDLIQTFDGGLVPLTATTRQDATPSTRWHVPAGAIGNCSNFELTAGQFVGFRGRMAHRLFGLPLVLAPASALGGFRGITRIAEPRDRRQITLAFASEEIAMAQTGALLHVPGEDGEHFLHRLDYGQTRSLLALTDPRNCAPDVAADLARA